MLFNDNGRNAALTGGIGNAVAYVGALTMSSVASTTLPDDTGSLEASGGSYARQGVTWGSAASGVRANSGSIAIPIPAGTVVCAISYHSALTSGTYYGNAPLNSTVQGVGTCAAADVTADTITSVAHGLTNGMRVFVANLGGAALPTGLAENTGYFVVGVTTDTFQLSATSGGSAINITATGGGELFFQNFVPETFTSAGSLAIANAALSLDASFL